MVKQQLVGHPSTINLLRGLDINPAFMLSANVGNDIPNSAPVIYMRVQSAAHGG
jgi:hypothetical protein